MAESITLLAGTGPSGDLCTSIHYAVGRRLKIDLRLKLSWWVYAPEYENKDWQEVVAGSTEGSPGGVEARYWPNILARRADRIIKTLAAKGNTKNQQEF